MWPSKRLLSLFKPISVSALGALLSMTIWLGLGAACTSGEEQVEKVDEQAKRVVAAALTPNSLGIKAGTLVTRQNPLGEGTLVYVKQTRFYGVERYLIWLVLNRVAYPLNGATKDLTPSLPWPREAPKDEWTRTGLDPFSPAIPVIDILFMGASLPTRITTSPQPTPTPISTVGIWTDTAAGSGLWSDIPIPSTATVLDKSPFRKQECCPSAPREAELHISVNADRQFVAQWYETEMRIRNWRPTFYIKESKSYLQGWEKSARNVGGDRIAHIQLTTSGGRTEVVIQAEEE